VEEQQKAHETLMTAWKAKQPRQAPAVQPAPVQNNVPPSMRQPVQQPAHIVGEDESGLPF
jgi:hypothetical protein